MAFPKEQINDETCELLEPYLQPPDFNFEMAQKASGSVAGLCNWCEAMKTYHFVAKVVDPKIIMLTRRGGGAQGGDEGEASRGGRARESAGEAGRDAGQVRRGDGAEASARGRRRGVPEEDGQPPRAHLRARGRGGALDGAVQAVRPADPATHGRLRARVVVRVLPRPVQQGVPRFALAAATFTATASTRHPGHARTST